MAGRLGSADKARAGPGIVHAGSADRRRVEVFLQLMVGVLPWCWPLPPALLLIPALLSLQEPESGATEILRETAPAGPMWRVLKMPTLWWIIASGALINFNMYAIGTFMPARPAGGPSGRLYRNPLYGWRSRARLVRRLSWRPYHPAAEERPNAGRSHHHADRRAVRLLRNATAPWGSPVWYLEHVLQLGILQFRTS